MDHNQQGQSQTGNKSEEKCIKKKGQSHTGNKSEEKCVKKKGQSQTGNKSEEKCIKKKGQSHTGNKSEEKCVKKKDQSQTGNKSEEKCIKKKGQSHTGNKSEEKCVKKKDQSQTGNKLEEKCVKKKPKPTVKPTSVLDPREDAAALRKAMKGFGTDEKAIIQVLTRRSNEQRLRIALEFNTVYGRNLIKDLKSETSGRFRDLLIALMTPLPEFYAKELHDAMEGLGTDDDVLIEVLCSLSNHKIKEIKEVYKSKYGRLLEDDLQGDTSGNFKRLMLSLCVADRSEDLLENLDKAREDAKSLHKAGKLRWGTDESMFISIMCSRSLSQLAATFREYQLIAGHDIDQAIKSEFSGDIAKALRAIVKVVRNQPAYFAEQLHASMKGLGTNDGQLIRIMVTRCEVDLGDIADVFLLKYDKTLENWIVDDTSGYYKKCLLGLLGVS